MKFKIFKMSNSEELRNIAASARRKFVSDRIQRLRKKVDNKEFEKIAKTGRCGTRVYLDTDSCSTLNEISNSFPEYKGIRFFVSDVAIGCD